MLYFFLRKKKRRRINKKGTLNRIINTLILVNGFSMEEKTLITFKVKYVIPVN